MESVIMNASIIATIVLCFVGIIKLPFKSFKTKHPKTYKTVFYLVSLILSIMLPILCSLYLMHLSLKSIEFYVLICTTVAGVFGLYSTYEGTNLKVLVKTICSKIKELCSKYSDSALVKTIEKVGIDKLNEIAKQLAEAKAATENPSEAVNNETK